MVDARLGRLAGAVLLALPVSCISVSSFQTARTQRQGEISTFTGIGYESIVFPRENSEVEDVKVPLIETGLRYGLCDRCDLGARLTVPGTFGADFKYQLTGLDDSLATAVAVGASTGSFEIGTTKYSVLDIYVPVFVSKDLSDTFSIYGSPRFMARSSTTEYEETEFKTDGTSDVATPKTEKNSANFFGTTVGFAWYWFVAEFGYFFAPGDQANAGITQVMVGYWGGWNETNKRTAAREAPPKHSKKKKR